MAKKVRRRFSEEQKRRAVDDYVSGSRSAVEVVEELEIAVGQLYRWKAEFEQRAKSGRVEKLPESGLSRASALKINNKKKRSRIIKRKLPNRL